jgi:hypothetical protein
MVPLLRYLLPENPKVSGRNRKPHKKTTQKDEIRLFAVIGNRQRSSAALGRAVIHITKNRSRSKKKREKTDV